jgi:hypothetical protein
LRQPPDVDVGLKPVDAQEFLGKLAQLIDGMRQVDHQQPAAASQAPDMVAEAERIELPQLRVPVGANRSKQAIP